MGSDAKWVEAAVDFAPYDNHERDAYAANDSRRRSKLGRDIRRVECRKREYRRRSEQNARYRKSAAPANECFEFLGENRAQHYGEHHDRVEKVARRRHVEGERHERAHEGDFDPGSIDAEAQESERHHGNVPE